MKNVTIEVGQDHIDMANRLRKAQAGSSMATGSSMANCCPVALAVKDHCERRGLRDAEVEVGYYSGHCKQTYVQIKWREGRRSYGLPLTVTAFIDRYDDCKDVYPFTFTLSNAN